MISNVSIFKYLSYRDWLQNLVGSNSLLSPYRSFGELAKVLEVQQAYLSRVLKGECNLNSDQLDRAIQRVALNESEADYLFLLLELERCQSVARKKRLRIRIEKYRQEARSTRNHIEAKFTDGSSTLSEQAYYLEPLAQVVHMCLHVRKFQSQPTLLGHELRISEDKLKAILKILVEAKLIEWNATAQIYVPKESNLQLVPNSLLSPANQILTRVKSQDHIQNVPSEATYQFNAVFSCDPITRGAIRDEFNTFLSKIKPLIKQASSEEVCQINFDLFRWAK